jgi:hypothetical protein
LTTNNKNHLRRSADGSVSVLCEQMILVAGARNHRELTTLSAAC